MTASTRTIRHLVPMASWLPAYNRGWLRSDLIAGLTLWGLLVPEAMAYVGIAGIQTRMEDQLQEGGVMAAVGEHVYPTVRAAVDAFESHGSQ